MSSYKTHSDVSENFFFLVPVWTALSLSRTPTFDSDELVFTYVFLSLEFACSRSFVMAHSYTVEKFLKVPTEWHPPRRDSEGNWIDPRDDLMPGCAIQCNTWLQEYNV